MKRELIYRFQFQTRNEAMKSIHHYIYSRYNENEKAFHFELSIPEPI
ncbi:IS3 family transposase [Alkalihalobacillus sp. NPDC078783]